MYWSLDTTFVHCVESVLFTRGTRRRRCWNCSSLCFTWFDYLFSASSDVGDLRETDSHPIHLSSPHLVTGRNIKVAVIVFWLISIPNMVVGRKDFNIFATLRSVLNFLAVLIVVSCVFFVVFAYVILYREVHRQRKNIKNQQLPQEEQQRIAKENKALKTTVLVVGAVLVCYVPVILTVLVFYLFGLDNGSCVYCPWVNTFIMFNSFINPLIYCWRQKEMRQYVLRFSCTSVVEPQPSP